MRANMGDRIRYILGKMAYIEQTQRDITLDQILDGNLDYDSKTVHDKFIDEVRDHLSTCINKSDFLDDKIWTNSYLFIIEKNCNCNVHIESVEDFKAFMRVLVSLYKQYDDFHPELIIKSEYLELL